MTKRSTHEAIVKRGEVSLAARLWIPSGQPPFPHVIFVHGLGSSKESPRNVVIAQHLVDTGIAAVLFDLSGHGESSLDARDGVEGYIEDLEAMRKWASEQAQIDGNRLGIAGSSLGGVVALHATIRNIVAPTTMVLRAPPVELDDFARLSVPTLVLIGSRDALLTRLRGIDTATKAVSLHVVDGASHLFEEPGTLEAATSETVRWFKTHLMSTGEVSRFPGRWRPAKTAREELTDD
jgi:putative phosphoribosyl transferase